MTDDVNEEEKKVTDLIPDLPAPWVFDGYKRIYEDGRPTGLWEARALNMMSLSTEEETGKMTADFLGGMGGDFEEAVEALLDAMKAPKPSQ